MKKIIIIISCLSIFLTATIQGIALDTNSKAKFLYVSELNNEIAIFETVWTPRTEGNLMIKMLNSSDLSWAKRVLDVGTGSGILGLIALKRGAGQVIATDINPAAVENAFYNAKKIGYGKVFEARLVDINEPAAFSVISKDEKFDLVISDPPWKAGKSANFQDYWLFDDNWVLLKSFIENLKSHLTENGKAWLYLGSSDAISLVLKTASRYGLKAVLIDHYSSKSYERAVIELKQSR